MSHDHLTARAANAYAEQLKTILSGAVTDSADLIVQLQAFDELPVNQNARLLTALKTCVNTLATSQAETDLIAGAVASLGARFEL